VLDLLTSTHLKMTLFRSLLFYVSVGATIYAGMKVRIPDETLVAALVPLLFLWIMVDVPHFLTLGLIDLSCSFSTLMKKVSIALPNVYSAMCLPIDVDDSGMMKQDKYVRFCGYALRKLWLKTGLEKELASSGFSLEVVSRSLRISEPIGLFSGFKIRSTVVCIRDDLDSFFVEQRLLPTGGDGGTFKAFAVSMVQLKVRDHSAHLRRKDDSGPLACSHTMGYALTRKIQPKKKLLRKGNPKADARLAEAETILLDIESLCAESKLKGPDSELRRFVEFCASPSVGPAAARKPTAPSPSSLSSSSAAARRDLGGKKKTFADSGAGPDDHEQELASEEEEGEGDSGDEIEADAQTIRSSSLPGFKTD